MLLADAFGLERPHVVGPDVGTAASLFAAGLHPDRLRSLTIGTGGAAYPLQLGGELKEWVEAPSLEPYRKMEGRQIVDAVIGILERYRLTDTAREDYLTSFAGDRFVESMRYVRAYPQDLPILRDLLPTIETPVVIINGSERPGGSPDQRRVSPRAAFEEQARSHRRGTFHLGGRMGPRQLWSRAGGPEATRTPDTAS